MTEMQARMYSHNGPIQTVEQEIKSTSVRDDEAFDAFPH